MEPLRQIREILRAWRERVEVLPAAGGALEDLLHPDAEEQEERAFTDERIFDTIWERAEGGERVSPYRPTLRLRGRKPIFFATSLTAPCAPTFWAQP